LTSAPRPDVDAWRRVREVFEAALELDPDGRARLLERECPGADLRREVESLLDAAERTRGALTGAVREASASLLGSVELEEGERLGPYRVVGELGRGGMGVVYLAARSDQEFEQRVAIKVASGLLGREAVDRFRSERQILANLKHPNIADLLDGGTTGRGLPYLVMEHVAGEPIDRHCDQRALSISQRIELFCHVCDAIDFAHRHLVVHRDLKPSNILVTPDGVPKLLDFGIAKLLDPGSMPFAVAETRPTTRLFTPRYASPEQVRGEPVTTASDTYSLGVLLYELLTGTPAQAVAEGSSSQAVERALCEDRPPRPSAALSKAADTASGADPASTAASRSTTPARLRHRLRGDLDAIVLKALHKEPERRYGSAGQLAEDLRRHLQGRPVSAKGESWAYLASKLMRRHRTPLLSAVAALLAVIGLVAFYGARLAAERDRAREAEAAAGREAERARRVSTFLTGIFEVANPEQNPGEAVTARELLDRGSESLERQLADQPEMLATMLKSMADAYLGLSLYERAGTLYRRVLELERELAAGPLEIAATLTSISSAANMQGSYPEAEEAVRQALAIRRRELGPDHPSVAASLDQLAGLLHTTNHPAESEQSYREALAILERQDPVDRPALAEVLDGLGTLLLFKGDLEGAAGVLDRGLAIRRALLPADHPQLLASVNSQAVLLKNLGRYEEAEPLYLEGLEGRRRAYGDGSVWVAQSANNYGVYLALRGRHLEARPLFEEAISTYLRTTPEAWGVYNTRSHLGATLTALGEHADAEDQLQLASEGLARTLGAKHGRTLAALERLAALYDAWRRPDDARRVRAELEGRRSAEP
jgi:eukaryotic-like serine/threonine-protein kinase